MTADISRYSLRPAQRFTGVVRQQGRLPLDSDDNEADEIATGMLRQLVAETICAGGSPDAGFRVGAVTVDPEVDLELAAGSYYLAGTRCESPGASYRSQPDWLTSDLDAAGPTAPGPGTSRTDLVWLEAGEQVVTATEDAELFERALGGADTAARRRVASRVRVLEDVSDDCADAVAELVAREFPGGTLAADGEVVSAVLLTVGFTRLEPLEDLCRPSAAAGFLGAENETFRVQVTTPGRFVWGRDNAAPLYRVQVEADDDGRPRRLVFLTPPRDEHGWPLAGMTVELLRWGALLANGEKAAEPAGLLLRVEIGYDPVDDSLLVGADVPADWDDWLSTGRGSSAASPRDPADTARYHYLRVWTGGGEGGDVDHAMTPGTAVALGETGLTATFTAPGLPGDHWVVAARPWTPTQVTPWALLDGAPPVGPRRLVAPLALLSWDGSTPTTTDCRHRFRPLCRVGGCCLVTVGDGRTSVGDVTSIQAAVDLLPPEGGEVCIHPGDYAEHVVVEGRRDVTISGCGRGTRWSAEPGRDEPLLTVRGSAGVVARQLAMTGAARECVLAEESEDDDSGAGLRDLLLADVSFVVSDAAAVACFGGRRHTLSRCTVRLAALSTALHDDPDVGRAAALHLSGDDLLVEHCRVEAAPDVTNRLRLPVGGLHIGGGSTRVTVRDCELRGGNGHGITLGSLQYVVEDDREADVSFGSLGKRARSPGLYHQYGGQKAVRYHGVGVSVDAQGCILLGGEPPAQDLPDDAPEVVPESGGVVRDVRILRNVIEDMGYSGISSHLFTGLGRQGLPDAMAVEGLEVAENRISGCLRNEVGRASAEQRLFTGWGGIALSVCADAIIRDNLIAGNGEDSAGPVAGIFLAVAEDVRVERNTIEGNGRGGGGDGQRRPGRHGGVVVGVAVGGLDGSGTARQGDSADRPALLVAGNTVDAPGGRALKALALGPCMVLGNRLSGAGRSALTTNAFASLAAAGVGLSSLAGRLFDPRSSVDLGDLVLLERISDVLGGDVVTLVNLCVAEDQALLTTGSTGFTTHLAAAAASPAPERLRGGETLVADNQVSLRAGPDARAGAHASAVLVVSADDVAFCDNQAEVEGDVPLVLTNLLAVAFSLRATGNRFQERPGRAVLSAVTYAVLNQTSLNQSTHCVFAAGTAAGRVVQGNRSLLALRDPEFCRRVDALGQSSSHGVSRRAGVAQKARG